MDASTRLVRALGSADVAEARRVLKPDGIMTLMGQAVAVAGMSGKRPVTDTSSAALQRLSGSELDALYGDFHRRVFAFYDGIDELPESRREAAQAAARKRAEPLIEQARAVHGVGNRRAALDELGDAAKDRHSRYYAEAADNVHRFDQVPELIAAINERGARVVLASSASPAEMEILERILDVSDAVHAITSAQDVESAKPDPDLVHTALEAAGVPAERAVFVGDTVWDVEAAERAGVPAVGVLTGGISAAELTEAGAVEVYTSVAEILEKLDSTPLRRAWES